MLYTRAMRHNPADAAWPNRDRFVLSSGHASMLLYSHAHLCRLRPDARGHRELPPARARRAPGHPEYGHAPGIEATTGPLGQGISHRRRPRDRRADARGLLQPRRARDHRPPHLHDRLRRRPQEGISSEATSLAGHLGLGRLIAFYDDNHISIEGNTALAFSEDVGARYEAYGWHVQRLGEDLALERSRPPRTLAKEVTDRPSLIICRTVIAPVSPNKHDSARRTARRWARRRSADQGGPTAGRPSRRSTCRPRRSRTAAQTIAARGEQAQRDWEQQMEAYRAAEPELAAQLDAIVEREGCRRLGRRPADASHRAPSHGDAQGPRGGAQAPADAVPSLIGGSADLAPSTTDADRRRRRRGGAAPTRAQPPLRHPRARHGRDRQRPGAARRPDPFWRDVPDLLRLHEGRRSAWRR